ncbi:MAG: DNA maturase B [Verrucomicrobiales bacterium]|nr:DNA maturase B [Verrucomicrobiales bacterium]
MAEQQIPLGQFCTALMRELKMADAPTPVQLQILDYLEKGPKRRTICAFRGCGKSTLSAMYILWRLYHNSELKVLILSASMSRSEAMSAWLLKTICDVPWLRFMEPDSHDGRYSKLAFDVGNCKHIEQSPSIKAAGLMGQITGSRADLICCDDEETPSTSLTQVQREKLRNQLNELEVILKPGEDSEIVYLGTPHSSTDSIYFALHRDLNYSMRMWPSRVPHDLTPYKGCLAPLIEARMPQDAGRPTDTRFSEDELIQRELSMSNLQNKLQMMLDATLSDVERFPLRCADLMIITIDQHLPEVMVYEKHRSYRIDDLACAGMAHDPYFYRPREISGAIPADEVATVMALDPSGGGTDAFGWCVMKAYAGNYFICDLGGHLGGVNDDFWKKLARTCSKWNVNEIAVESNFGGLAIYQQILLPYLRAEGAECRVEAVRANQRKELRVIDTLAPLMQTHRLACDRRVIEADNEILKNSADDRDSSYSFQIQLSRLTHAKGSLLHDDLIDVTATAAQWLQEQAAQDQHVMKEARFLEMIEATIADEDGWMLMNPDRQALGMTIEQCKQAEMLNGSRGGSWI